MKAVFRAAPWSKSLIGMSILSTLVLSATVFFGARSIPAGGVGHWIGWGGVVAVLVAMLATILLVVREFELKNDVLRVKRLFWHTVLPLNGLYRIEHDPALLKDSLRLFGNGGMFSFTGRFRNKRLGTYRAFVTNEKCCVAMVMRHSVVVVSPENVEKFMTILQQQYPALQLESSH